MAASHGLLYLVLWTAAVVETGHGCPQLCVCNDQSDRHVAECTSKRLSEIPSGLPPNITTLRLSVNKISFVTLGSLDGVTALMSLWMPYNKMVAIEAGSLAPLIRLRNLDISHNRLVDFPWEDLRNLRALQMLKMNHNELVMLPKDAFASLKYLKSLCLDHNKLITVAQGTFDGLISLSYLQLYDNPFTCNCFIDWLRDWILTTTISVQEIQEIICANPQPFKELVLVKLPQSKCMGPNVTITAEPNIDRTHLYEETSLSLTCEFIGNPKPAIMWRIRSRSHRQSLVMPSGDDVSDTESTEDSSFADKPFKVFSNGTLMIFHISSKDSGNYSCTATNELGTAQDIVAIEVVTLMKPTATKKGSNPMLRQKITITPVLATPDETPFLLSAPPPPPPTQPPPSDMTPEYHKGTQRISTHAMWPDVQHKYVSNHGFNGSLEDVKQYTFDFGVIALSVSETEARVRLNPLLTSKDYAGTAGTADATTTGGRRDTHLEGLYLCISSDLEHLAVAGPAGRQHVRLPRPPPRPNYSLCLTYTGQDCDVQVLFTTRRAAPNLLVIVSVCIGLLTVSTVPLLGATCYHLVYKYRGKTYQLILKTRDRYQAERDLGAHFHLHATLPSRRKINSSELEEEEEGRGKSGRQGEEEGSQGTESFAVSGDDCEACSEYSDRLPLGAEAINITSNYKYP
ncbi:LOW QUALITY PROTEIN: hypothetical protein CRUP_012509 [Coryphaenoides rupestris]|nr:LOW QUALITY PROTEIN: hypothetical protein CRUP_012509 [Coryphaenoides rupestris]